MDLGLAILLADWQVQLKAGLLHCSADGRGALE